MREYNSLRQISLVRKDGVEIQSSENLKWDVNVYLKVALLTNETQLQQEIATYL